MVVQHRAAFRGMIALDDGAFGREIPVKEWHGELHTGCRQRKECTEEARAANTPHTRSYRAKEISRCSDAMRDKSEGMHSLETTPNACSRSIEWASCRVKSAGASREELLARFLQQSLMARLPWRYSRPDAIFTVRTEGHAY